MDLNTKSNLPIRVDLIIYIEWSKRNRRHWFRGGNNTVDLNDKISILLKKKKLHENADTNKKYLETQKQKKIERV